MKSMPFTIAIWVEF